MWRTILVVAMIMGWVCSGWATNYTWTNTVPDASGYWTNGVLWNSSPSAYPGSSIGDSAFLTNQFSGTSTNILDVNPGSVISTLSIANGGGEAWLIVTNGATLIAPTLSLGSGARLEIDSGSVVTGATTFTWTGNNSSIWLNNGSKFNSLGVLVIGNVATGVSARVTSASEPGAGGVWNMTAQNLTIGSGLATGNQLVIDNGAMLTNAGSVTIGTGGATFNSLTLSNGGILFGAGATVGTGQNSSNNLYAVGGGGAVSFATHSGLIAVGISGGGYNSMIVSNARLSSAGLTIGGNSSNNTVTVLSNGIWNLTGSAINIGQAFNTGAVPPITPYSTGNVLRVDGGVLTNASAVNLGFVTSGQGISTYNSLLVTNGGKIFMTGALSIGGVNSTVGSSNNSVTVTGRGSVISNATAVTVGNTGSSNNTLTIADGAWLFSTGGGNIGAGGGMSRVRVTGVGSVWSNAVAPGNSIVLGQINGGNSLLIETGAVVTASANPIALTIGGNAAASKSNLLTVTGAGAALNLQTDGANGGGLSITLGGFNRVVVANSGRVVSAGITIGTGGSNNSVTVSDTGSVWQVYNSANPGSFVQLGTLANAFGNQLIISNGGGVVITASAAGSSIIGGGAGANNNSAVVTGGGSAWTNISMFALIVGSSGAFSNSLTVTDGGALYSSALTVGSGQNANNNSFLVRNGLSSNGVVTIGAAGGGFNSMAAVSSSVMNSGLIVGNGSSNNTASVGPGTTWNLLGGNVTVGSNAAVANSVVVNGGTLNNVGIINIGATAGSSGNSVTVSNGGVLIGNGAVIIGGVPGVFNNAYNVGGLGLAGTVSNNGGIFLADNGVLTGGSFNSVTVSNANFWSTGFEVGRHGQDNTASVLSNSVWNLMGGAITIGIFTGGNRNTLLINGGIMTNVGLINVGTIGGGNAVNGQSSDTNSLTIVNGGRLFSSDVTIGISHNSGVASSVTRSNTYNVGGFGAASFVSNGLITINGYDNTMTVTNATLLSGAAQIGFYSLTNTAKVLAGGVWNLQGNTIVVGTANLFADNAVGNVLAIDGGMVTNAAAVTIGLTQNAVPVTTNGLVVRNGGRFYSGNVSIGNRNAGGTAVNNYYLAGGGAQASTISNGTIIIGDGGNANFMVVTNASLMSRTLTLGNGGTNNSVSVLANSTWNLLGNSINVGVGASTPLGNWLTIHNGRIFNGLDLNVGGASGIGNSVVITNGGTLLLTGSVAAGGAVGANSNSVLVVDGGLLEAGSLTVRASTVGNTISNRNATYQFATATPVITPNGAGSIAITDGTISFRAINNADVTNNLGRGALSGITFAGANTFQLNGASNTTAGQTYTFQSVAGNPSNYVSLAMVNGSTAYRGGDLTIGTTGSMLVSSTTAMVTGLFTNNGLTRVVNASAAFSNGIVNAGVLALQSGTVSGGMTNLLSGTVQGNGTIQGSVTNFGTITPGFSVGSLTITGNLSLAGSSLVVMELFAVGSNDTLNVGQLFTYGGTLTVTNSSGFTLAAGQSFQLFTFGNQGGDFGTTNLPDLAIGLGWDTTQLDSLGIVSVVVIPEPSAFLLLAGAIAGLWCFSRRSTCRA